MSRVHLGVQEPGGARGAEATQAMGAVEQDTHQCCSALWCTVLHKARAGLEQGWEAEDAQAAWSRVSGCLHAPQGWLCTLHGGSGCLHPARACGAHPQAGARGRSGW